MLRKTVSVPIVANAFHGKDIIFYFNIEEPKLIGKGIMSH